MVMLMVAAAAAGRAAAVASGISRARAVLEVDSIDRTRMPFSLQDLVLSVV